ncbi:hypothetical protein D3C87_1764030 [compost metagenome]
MLNALGMGAAWVASNLAGAVFHRYVESVDVLQVLREAIWPTREKSVTSEA